MSKVICVVQARMASTRFPGKVLVSLNGMPVIQHVLRRCMQIKGIDLVVCATSRKPSNLPLIEFCESRGYTNFADGKEDDVLGRYLKAANYYGASVIMRVTGDCPLIEPRLCERVLHKFLHANPPYDIVSNDYPVVTFAKGLGCEVMSRKALEEADRQVTNGYDREHVSPWMCRNMRHGSITNDMDESDVNLEINYPEDIKRLEGRMSA